MGQAAGVAAALCARRGCAPRDVARTPTLLSELQQTLRGQGAHLGTNGPP